MLAFVVSLLAAAALLAAGLPLALFDIPRNTFYGFRVGKALEDDNAWRLANRASGRWLAITGVALAIAATISFTLSGNTAIAALVNGLIVTLGVIIAVAAGFTAMSADDFRR